MKHYFICLAFFSIFVSFFLPVKCFAGSNSIVVSEVNYPHISGYYNSEKKSPSVIYLNGQPFNQTLESVVFHPITENPKLYLLIQNTSSYESLQERADREIYLMKLEKRIKSSSFFKEIVVYTFASSISEIPFPKDKLSMLVPDKNTLKTNQLEILLSLIESMEKKSSLNSIVIVIGDGKIVPKKSGYLYPIFYLQTNNQVNQSLNFFTNSSGGEYFQPSTNNLFEKIETIYFSESQPIHYFSFVLPWFRFISKNTISIPEDPDVNSALVHPAITLNGILHWIVFILLLFISIFIILLLIKHFRLKRKKNRKRKKEKIEMEKKLFSQKSLELTIIDPEKNVKLVLVKNPVTIGSSYDCQINLNDYSVSSEHCYIGKTKNGFFVVDLNSCNGIKVNNNEVDKTFLKDNDTILIGETIIEVKEIFVE